jgi:hypothetical protein
MGVNCAVSRSRTLAATQPVSSAHRSVWEPLSIQALVAQSAVETL